MNENTPNYWAQLTADVRYDKNLSANAKLLYAELTALTSVEGYAWASNSYFANLYDLSECQISRLINSLADTGYIKIELTRNPKDKRITMRKIWLIKNDNPGVRKNDKADHSKNAEVHHSKNRKDNNTKNITNNITNSADADEFEKLFPNQEKKSFKRNDYTECVSLISSIQNTLKNKGYNIDLTQYPIPVLNKWLKKWFEIYGVEETKKGIINSISNQWLIKTANYSLSALFSDNVFPKCVSNSEMSSAPSIQKGKTFFEDKQRDFSDIEQGGDW